MQIPVIHFPALSAHYIPVGERLDQRRESFLRWITTEGTNIAKIAAKTGIPRTTLYGYARGDAQTLKGHVEQAIAQAFGTTTERIFNDRTPLGRVGVFGKIGARADVYPIDDDHRDTPMYEVPMPAGVDPDGDYVAFEIEGFSMPPAEPGWLVYFRKVEVTPDDLLNSPCLVDLADGRRLFKRLRRGYAPGLYNLESWDGSALIENVEVVGALPYASLTPGRNGR